ncbi:hypothetical protein DL240_03825 [Lujinxingia litoralis]|uniref:Cytochrome c assembly protein domain-containing protein n=1 Tax=Lujinxingia litoralis TaxID=2211119 RepID=A0A328CE22_9DELT|nr:cytochrome c biogenesis protein CcsA [Lujinxingia litoralis]RAL25349.1 hypothetical protein DL240_03825 [Lujinxingia litoralis]
MLMLFQLVEIALPVAYLAIFALYARQFLARRDAGERFVGSPLLYGTLGVHATYLALRGVELSHFPVSSKGEFLSLLALAIGFIYALTERRHGEPNTGAFFVALTALAQTWSSLIIDPTAAHPLLHEHPIYGVHVILILLGFVGLAMSAIYALMYVLLARQLKSRDLGALFRRLPSLHTLENMSRMATLAGILLLGLGLVSGHFVAVYVLDDFSLLDPKIVITYVAWAAYAVAFVVAKMRKLSGLRMGYLSLGGYLALIASMVVVNTFFSSFHTFQ